jgi:hypothetical protein
MYAGFFLFYSSAIFNFLTPPQTMASAARSFTNRAPRYQETLKTDAAKQNSAFALLQQSAARKVRESAGDNLKEHIRFLFTKYYFGDRLEKDNLDGDCTKHRTRGKSKPLGADLA